MLRTPYFWAGLVLFSLVYFAATLTGNPVVVVVWAALAGVLGVFLLELSFAADGAPMTWAAPSVLAAASVVAGTILKAIMAPGGSPVTDAAAVPIAALAALGFVKLRHWSRPATCSACRLPTAAAELLSCPRCGQLVCARPSCWSGRHLRCESCAQREVVLLPIRDEWWNRQLGPRVLQGACESCYKEAQEADLRACGQCPLLMCRRCWDHHNGQCLRCRWLVPDLPPSIWPYLARPAREAGGGRRRG